MITPIRGRKLRWKLGVLATLIVLKDDNPDKGTETTIYIISIIKKFIMLKDDNPDKGTETHFISTPTIIKVHVER